MCRAVESRKARSPADAGGRCPTASRRGPGPLKSWSAAPGREDQHRCYTPLPTLTVTGVAPAAANDWRCPLRVRTVAGALDVRPIMEGITRADADTYLEAAMHQARLAMGLNCMDVEP